MAELAQDPTKAAPPTDPQTLGQETVTVPKEEFEGMKKRLDVFDQYIATQQAQPPPQPPPVQQGPTVAEQVTKIDEELADIDKEIDKAIGESKPVSSLMRRRDELNEKRTTLRITAEHIDPMRNAGFTTIDQLSGEVLKGQMPYLTLASVKNDYDDAINKLPPEQRMNPQMRRKVYELSVGMHMEEILEAKKEEILREATPSAQVPGDTTGREQGGGSAGEIPKPEDVLSAEAMTALRTVGKTPDQYFQGMGYGGWSDYYEKRLAESTEE